MVFGVLLPVIKSWFGKMLLSKGTKWAVAALVAVFGDNVARAVIDLFDGEEAEVLKNELQEVKGPPTLEPRPGDDPLLVEGRFIRDRLEERGACVHDVPSRRMHPTDSVDAAFEALEGIQIDRRRLHRAEPDQVVRLQHEFLYDQPPS